MPLPAVNKILTLLKKCALCDLERTGWAGREGTLSPNSVCWKRCQDEKLQCSTQNKKIHHKTCHSVCYLLGISGSQVSCFNRGIPPNQFLFHASLQVRF